MTMERGPRTRRWSALAVVVLLLGTALIACTPSPGATPPNPTVGGSVNQVYVIKAPASATVHLIDAKGATVQSGTTDSLGGFLFRQVSAGTGYRVVTTSGNDTATSVPVNVTTPDVVPPQSLYASQHFPVVDSGTGYGYIRTRDGTTLSAQVALPGPASRGPYPVLLEYSGYDPSNPVGQSGTSPFKILAQLLGYAYVGVNVRGSGCSGGAFDLFEKLQSLDGYDAVETIAAQPWAGRIGTVGISYPGIMQLFLASTRPPHLASIAPLSTTDDLVRSILAPGGIKNDGFALAWITSRVNQNKWPDPQGAGWVVNRIQQGDAQCAYNMQLRQQNRDVLAIIAQQNYYPAVGDPLYPEGGDGEAPWTFADRINVPTFIAGAWQDEQTGGRWPDLLSHLTSVPKGTLKITATNGAHTESLDPQILLRLTEFLDVYVAHRVPQVPAVARVAAPAIYQAVYGINGIQLPPDRFTGVTDYAAARATLEAEPPVRILWETGAAPNQAPGAPFPVTETSYSAWPPPQTAATTWYLQPDGTLASTPPSVADGAARGGDSYTSDPGARPRNDFPGGNIWAATPTYNWTPLVDGKALSWVSAPLAAPVSMLGNGSVDLWLRSTAPDTDLQVTLTEVRADGTERYVQNGWLRASDRKLDVANSTALLPRHTGLASDAAPLPAGRFSSARVELFPFAYTFRAGSRIRISVEAPGGDRPVWTFITPAGGEVNSIAHSIGLPSKIVLPVVPTVPLPAAPAPCPSLRSEPCRTYVGPANPTDVRAVGRQDAAIVSWTAPAVPAGRTLTGYVVTPSRGGASVTVVADTTSAWVGGLPRGRYTFTVTAQYADGPSAPSTASLDTFVL